MGQNIFSIQCSLHFCVMVIQPFYSVQYIQYTFLKIVWSLAKNRTYPGWSRWTGICLVSFSFTDIQYMYVLYVLKIQSHIVASAPAVRGWVFMRRFGLGQCWQLIPFYSISTTDALIVIKKFLWQCLNFHVPTNTVPVHKWTRNCLWHWHEVSLTFFKWQHSDSKNSKSMGFLCLCWDLEIKKAFNLILNFNLLVRFMYRTVVVLLCKFRNFL